MSSFITISNIENKDGCIPPLNFKPGSIGEKVSFIKTPSTPTDIIIPGYLEITRNTGGYDGIYNIATETGWGGLSPQFTTWNTQYVDSDDTNWASLTDIQNRTYLTWINAISAPAGGFVPSMYVGMRSIMKYNDGSGVVKYYLIIFTAWQVCCDGHFAYDRYEILDGVYVEQLSSDNPAPQVIDNVSDGVNLARRYQGGALYNILYENAFNQGTSPFNTRWNSIFTDSRPGYSGFLNLNNLESRVYTDFASALDGAIGDNIPGTDLIMHDLTTDVYHKIDFSAWAQGCGGPWPGPGCFQGGFAYTRTPIPQSCGITLADGTVINSASSLGVQTVTGLNTNNTDPLNPVIQVSVDGTTITGAGTPASPLVAVATCKPEFIKIASHSCNLLPGAIQDPELVVLFGGRPYNAPANFWPIWSTELNNYSFDFATPIIKSGEKTLAIACPANLVKNDVLRISGTAYFNNVTAYIESGYDVRFFIAVSEFDCTKYGEIYESFTLIPIQNYTFDKDKSLCFSAEVTLAKNYDFHSTRFLVGAGATAICLEDPCGIPVLENDNVISLSYTLDVERPCAAGADNYIIRNCCEPIITELVYAPEGLEIDSFISDDEGNCWEVISLSNDVTNFTRNFVNDYVSCAACQDANECPANLVIQSCCVEGFESVTGSLPGLVVGDTFVDNNGLCWEVKEETPGPVSEESITVSSIIMGDCDFCTSSNPCPNIYIVSSCCGKLNAIISTTTELVEGDAFVDQEGVCWRYEKTSEQLPTNYDIEVVTVYPGTPLMNGCNDCKTANPCPEEYFLTIRACCDTDRVEVTLVPSINLFVGEGAIIADEWGLCWEVMSVSVVGTQTYQIWDWTMFPSVPRYALCQDCIAQNIGEKGICRMIYEVIDCVTGLTYIVDAIFQSIYPPIFGQYYFDKKSQRCYEIIGYGFTKPDFGINLVSNRSAGSCELCNLYTDATRTVNLQNCCTGSTITASVTGVFDAGVGATYYLEAIGSSLEPSGCYTLLGLSTSPTLNTFDVTDSYTGGCIPCLADYDPC